MSDARDSAVLRRQRPEPALPWVSMIASVVLAGIVITTIALLLPTSGLCSPFATTASGLVAKTCSATGPYLSIAVAVLAWFVVAFAFVSLAYRGQRRRYVITSMFVVMCVVDLALVGFVAYAPIST